MPDDIGTAKVIVVDPDSIFSVEAEEQAVDRRRKRHRKLALFEVAAVVAAAAAGAGVQWKLVGARYATTDNAYVGAQTAQINSQVSGPVLEVRVADTEAVRKGDVLAVIDPADAELAVARAEADYQKALQRIRQYQAQEGSAAAQVRVRQAEAARAATDYDRRRRLAETGAISKEELTQAQAAYDAARANLAAAGQQLAAQRALTQGTGVVDHPEARAARAAWDTARLALSRTVIRAPIDGVVVQRKVQVGQRVDPGQPLMTVAPIGEAYVDANFKENQLGDVRVGQPVELTSDLYGGKTVFHGRVTGLGGGTGSAFAVIPAQNATGNWIKVVQRVPVRIALDPRELVAHPLRVGLSMEARIDTRANVR
jgi:membrane fusion protein (multidrug efflux system)